VNALLQLSTAFAVGYLLGVSIRQKWFKNRQPPALIKLGLAAGIFLSIGLFTCSPLCGYLCLPLVT